MPDRPARPARRTSSPSTPTLAQVQGKTLRELAYDELRRALIAGQFAPGEAVTIADIANRLKIGVMPAREAVQQLASQGAFEFLANRSVRVPVTGREELDDLFEARLLVETDLVRRACANRDGFAGDRLGKALADLEAATSSRDMRASLTANYAFHFSIYRAARSPTLAGLAELLWLRMSPLHVAVFRADPDRRGSFFAALPAHKDLTGALTSGNQNSATMIFQAMLVHSRDWHREQFDGDRGLANATADP